MPDPLKITADDIYHACAELTHDQQVVHRIVLEDPQSIMVGIKEGHERVKAALALLSPDGTDTQRVGRLKELAAILGFDAVVYLTNFQNSYSMFLTPKQKHA